jgi:hypothetical protein
MPSSLSATPGPDLGSTGPSPSAAASTTKPEPRTGTASNRNRHWLWTTLAVVVVAGLVLSGLALAGFLPFSQSSPPPTYPTYAQATSLAVAAANASYGSGWGVVSAAFLDSPRSVAVQFVGSNGPNFCAFLPFQGTGIVTIPATKTSFASGQSAYWAFALRNSTGGILGVSVADHAANVFGYGNARCRLLYNIPQASLVPSAVIDSDRAMAIAGAAGGNAFLQAHSGGEVTAQIEGNFSLISQTAPSLWEVDYSNCAIDQTGTGTSNPANSTLIVEVNPFNGTVRQKTSTEGFCPDAFGAPVAGITPLGTVLDLGAPVPSFGLDSQISACATVACSFNNFTMTSVTTANLHLGDLGFEVTSATGTPITQGGSVALFDALGQLAGIYSLQGGNWTSGGLQLTVSTNYTLALFEVGGSTWAAGDSFIVTGYPGFTGSVGIGPL